MHGSWRRASCLQHARIDPHCYYRSNRAAARRAEPHDLGAAGANFFHRAVDGMPSGADRSGTTQRGGTMTADPDRRVRLLNRLGFEMKLTELRVLPGE